MQIFTNEVLIQYIYNELNTALRAELEKELQSNWALKEKLKVFMEAHNRLNHIKLSSPRQNVIDNIMHYAHNSSEVTSEKEF